MWRKLIKGEAVRVRKRGCEEWTRAVVALVSPNGQSVALRVEGLIPARGGFVGGVLPLLIDFDFDRIEGLDDTEYEIQLPNLRV
jgi:hypothetical protein